VDSYGLGRMYTKVGLLHLVEAFGVQAEVKAYYCFTRKEHPASDVKPLLELVPSPCISYLLAINLLSSQHAKG
jgi:hypothetical protein